MNITFLTENIRHITPSEGCVLAFRGSSSEETFKELFIPKKKDISNIIEFKKENIPSQQIIEIDEQVQYESVDKIQQHLIQKSKILLKKFLEEHPLSFQGNLYSVTSDAQQNLHSVIKAAEYANSLNINYIPMWNSYNGIRQNYNLETLQLLFIKIQQYVLNFVIQQQQMEVDILNTTDKTALLNYNIYYSL